jgi:type IV pilus assembly protein PilO
MLATRSSRWTAGALVLCVLLLVGFWFLLVGPRRAEAADLNAQRDSAIAQNGTLQLEIDQLKAQSAALPQREAKLAEIKREFPPQVQLPKLIRDLDTLATQSGVDLTSLTPSTPTAVTATGAAAAGGTSATAAGGTGKSAQAATGLLSVPITMELTGDYFQVAGFLKRLQQQDRATLVSSLQIASGSGPGDVTTSVAGMVFVLPDTPAEAAAQTGTGQPAAPGTPGTGTTIQ